MNIPDVINGSFECLGGFFILASVRKLYKDKKVHGIHWLTTLFFAAWGYWNLFYYPHLGQWLSFMGGIFVTATNTLWVVMLIHYSRKSE